MQCIISWSGLHCIVLHWSRFYCNVSYRALIYSTLHQCLHSRVVFILLRFIPCYLILCDSILFKSFDFTAFESSNYFYSTLYILYHSLHFLCQSSSFFTHFIFLIFIPHFIFYLLFFILLYSNIHSLISLFYSIFIFIFERFSG